MSVKTFDELLNIVKSDLDKEQNIKDVTIPAAHYTLNFLYVFLRLLFTKLYFNKT
jgi:hypothetical protein